MQPNTETKNPPNTPPTPWTGQTSNASSKCVLWFNMHIKLQTNPPIAPNINPPQIGI
ncbi:hypothetical protein IKD56_04965 [bacterium]|nr:hypothetical protein [bacterium]